MSTKSIFKLAIMPILLLILMISVEYIFALISEPNTSHVVLGVVLLSVLVGGTLYIVKKIYLKDE